MEKTMEEKGLNLNAVQIATMYVGAHMGAGFASGKEMWQFFGVFGMKGVLGILLATAIFILFGYVSAENARILQTADFSKMISPIESKRLERVIAVSMSVFLWMAYLSMVSAGGTLLEEQFGVHHAIGSAIYMLLVVFTAIKGFAAVSSRIGKVTPILVSGVFLICLYIIGKDYGNIGRSFTAEVSPLAKTWATAAIAFVAYNLTAGIPIMGNCTINAKDRTHAWVGGVLGGLALGICCTILYLATLTNPDVAGNTAFPVLGFSAEISYLLSFVYVILLLLGVFGTSTSCIYGITTKIPQSQTRVLQIWFIALSGYGLSLFGFNTLVAVLYPIGGYFSLALLVLMLFNFFLIKSGKRKTPEILFENNEKEKGI